jgi:hypothetical protein
MPTRRLGVDQARKALTSGLEEWTRRLRRDEQAFDLWSRALETLGLPEAGLLERSGTGASSGSGCTEWLTAVGDLADGVGLWGRTDGDRDQG